MIYTEKGKTTCNFTGAEEATADLLCVLHAVRKMPGFDDTFLHVLVDVSKMDAGDFRKMLEGESKEN